MAKYMIIDGIRADFDQEKNILQVINSVGIHVPTLCYYSDLSIYGACRMCMVEDERGSLIASCSTPPKHGMVIKTNTPRLQHHRRMILELLLASHCRDCTVCEKNQTCRLQELAARLELNDIRFPNTRKPQPIDDSSPSIVRDPSKCILCGDCVRVCNEVQHVGAIDFAQRGSEAIVTPAFGKKLSETDCVNCGRANFLRNLYPKAMGIMVCKLVIIYNLCTWCFIRVHAAIAVGLARHMILNFRIILVIFCQLIDECLISAINTERFCPHQKYVLYVTALHRNSLSKFECIF